MRDGRPEPSGDPPRPSAEAASEAAAAATRCWLVHRWGPWQCYELLRPARVVGPALRYFGEASEKRRRRRCLRCGRAQDELLGVGPHRVD